MKQIILQVTGLNCAGCVGKVEKALKAVPGVQQASVNLSTGKARVEYAKIPVSRESLVAAVRQAGFDVMEHEEPGEPGELVGVRGHGMHGVSGRAGEGVSVWWIWGGAAVFAVTAAVLSWHGSGKISLTVQMFLSGMVLVMCGREFFVGMFKGLRHGRVDMDTLVGLGSGIAYLWSVLGWFMERPGTMYYFDTAAMIVVFVSLGRRLEHRARQSAGSAIARLMELAPAEAQVLRDGKEKTIPTSQLRVGDHVRIRPGGRVPADGQVIEGRSTVDQSMVTGESEPIPVGVNDPLIGGTLNQTGALTMRVTRSGRHTFLAHVIDLVEQAQASKASIQRLADRIASVFVPIVLLIALATLLVWGMVLGQWAFGFGAMIAVLVCACPCALGLATPTAIMVGTGLGAKHGILIKNAAALETAGKIKHILLDKTGTLTLGRGGVNTIHLLKDSSIDEGELLRLAASAELSSEHPLGRALVEYARQQGISLTQPVDFQSMTGGGIAARVGGRSVLVGRTGTLRQQQVQRLDELIALRDQLADQARTMVAVAVEGVAVALVTITDRIRPSAVEVVRQLVRRGLAVGMISGDRREVAVSVAQQVGIDPAQVMAPVLPQDKQTQVRQLQQTGAGVAMVGDGINDAPALAAADLGIAVGHTEVALEAGDIVLGRDDLWLLVDAIDLSRATIRTIWLGLFWAFFYNLAILPLAAVGLVVPMLAAFAMSLSSVSVVCNALWLRRRWKPVPR